MKQIDDSDALLSEINVTPFVDVMLVLLIIFMVTAPLVQTGVKVDLPQTQAMPVENPEKPLIISLPSPQIAYLNDQKIELNLLYPKVEAILKTREKRELFLRADRKLDYGFIVDVMANLKRAGAVQVGLVTDPKQ